MTDSKDYIAITGIPLPDGLVEVKTKTIPYAKNMPKRYEITEWFEMVYGKKDPAPGVDRDVLQKQWTLFVLGLERFKNTEIENKRSYFQVAGIHGYPQTSWDGAEKPRQGTSDEDRQLGKNPHGGYCHHNTIAFPTWHRPYMLLYEVRS